ncbi:hypothetical protein [Arenimonas fontis]|uniref:Uncharacterized protein n=1 Tax=Arenimonas fontis TaxID=2608255 RepID=A0A5B2ZAV8_9GAMM|nr:hypothetical protein [Arenimonas fontis]KAA2284683.1 hypothetical protein F0415_08265 [Arenimonas fontis]
MSARRLLLLCCLLLAPALAAADDVAWSNKWRLQFSGAAESAGEIVLEVRDRAGARFEVTVPIEGNDGENRVASKVRRALDRALPSGWRVERDDGEDVLVKRRWYHPRFTLRIVRSSVKDLRIGPDRE